METVNVRQLKNNPSKALRDAKREMVLVMNRDQPDSLLIGLNQLAGIPNMAQVRLALAASLFKERRLSIGAASKVAGKSVPEMVDFLSSVDIPLVDYSVDDVFDEVSKGQAWIRRK
jgi:predicted HTH domain antitoxin